MAVGQRPGRATTHKVNGFRSQVTLTHKVNGNRERRATLPYPYISHKEVYPPLLHHRDPLCDPGTRRAARGEPHLHDIQFFINFVR